MKSIKKIVVFLMVFIVSSFLFSCNNAVNSESANSIYDLSSNEVISQSSFFEEDSSELSLQSSSSEIYFETEESLSEIESEDNSIAMTEDSSEGVQENEMLSNLNTYYQELLLLYNNTKKVVYGNGNKYISTFEYVDSKIYSLKRMINDCIDKNDVSAEKYEEIMGIIDSVTNTLNEAVEDSNNGICEIIFYNEVGEYAQFAHAKKGEGYVLPNFAYNNWCTDFYDLDTRDIYLCGSTLIINRDYRLEIMDARYVEVKDYISLKDIESIPDGSYVENIKVVTTVNDGNNYHFVTDENGIDMLIYDYYTDLRLGQTFVFSGIKTTDKDSGKIKFIDTEYECFIESAPIVTAPIQINESNINEEWVEENNYEYYKICKAKVVAINTNPYRGFSLVEIGNVQIPFYNSEAFYDTSVGEIVDIYCALYYHNNELRGVARHISHYDLESSVEVNIGINYSQKTTHHGKYGDKITLKQQVDTTRYEFKYWMLSYVVDGTWVRTIYSYENEITYSFDHKKATLEVVKESKR